MLSWAFVKNKEWDLRFQANLQRSRFYDVPSIFTDNNGQAIIAGIGINTNYNNAR